MSKPITIRKERFYPQPPEDVWTALTDPHALAEWLMPNNHKPIKGHKFQFRYDPNICGPGINTCEVIEADPPRKLVWSWINEPKEGKPPQPNPMYVSFTLIPENNGTRLIFEQSEAQNIGWIQRGMMRMGWGHMMKRLIPKILNNTQNGQFKPGAIPLNKRCYKCETIPDEYIR